MNLNIITTYRCYCTSPVTGFLKFVKSLQLSHTQKVVDTVWHPDMAWLINKHCLKSSSKADTTFSIEQSPCFVVMTIEFPLISKWCKRAINTSIIACWTIIVSTSPSSKACFRRAPSCRRWNENKSINFSLFYLQLSNFFRSFGIIVFIFTSMWVDNVLLFWRFCWGAFVFSCV